MRRNDLIRAESTGSSFLTLRFLQIAAIAALGAGLVVGRLEAILLAALLVASVNVARLWCRRAARACSIEVELSRSRLYPGEVLAISVRAGNHGLLPIRVRAAVPDSGGPASLSGDRGLAPEARAPLLEGETGLLAFQQVCWRQQVVAGRRGVYELGPVSLEAGDLLGFFRLQRREPDRLEVIVYPRLVPVVPLALPEREFFGSRMARTRSRIRPGAPARGNTSRIGRPGTSIGRRPRGWIGCWRRSTSRPRRRACSSSSMP